jgi:3-oxoacyl-[acyl-carrier protein] reductase
MAEKSSDDAMRYPLAGRVAIVTGGGRDIGRACAVRLAAAGAAVAINYHSSEAGAQSAVDEIEASGGRALAVRGDMTSDGDVATLVSDTRAAFGDRIDILVHVTGGLVARRTLAEMDVEHWNRVMDLNATSFFRVGQGGRSVDAGGRIGGGSRQPGRS